MGITEMRTVSESLKINLTAEEASRVDNLHYYYGQMRSDIYRYMPKSAGVYGLPALGPPVNENDDDGDFREDAPLDGLKVWAKYKDKLDKKKWADKFAED